MPTPATLPDDLLKPIRPDKQSGDDLRAASDWAKMKNARPNPDDGDRGIWTKQNSGDAGWPQLLELTTGIIRKKSKDLQIAIWLTEASTCLNGFAGLRDSLALIRELLVQFWDNGLLPLDDDGDTSIRRGPLQWLNDKLPDLIHGIPLTSPGKEGEEYSYAYFLESRRTGGSITAEQFEESSRATSLEHFQNLFEDCELAREELASLQLVTETKFDSDPISFGHTKEAFEDCSRFLKNLIVQRTPKTAGGPGTSTLVFVGPNGMEGTFGFGSEPGPSDGSWDEAERLVRSGKIAEGLSEMTKLAATAPNGRVRFHRKLLLADICLATRRDILAKSILEELAELIETHHLEQWESSQVTGAVWSRLYRCYKNEQAGTADSSKASQLFLKLCRLDPWQALACGDGK